MFESARIKLTIWYVCIIMFISLSFSLIIYRLLTNEFKTYENLYWFKKETQIKERFFNLPECSADIIFRPDIGLQKELLNHLKFALLLINLGIFGLSSAGSYLLAGKTLGPIQEMVEQQRQFISDASHELRTPLAAMKCEIEVNLRDKELQFSDAKFLLQSNLEEVDRLHLLTENLLKLTSYENSKSAFSFEDISLKEILETAIKKIDRSAKTKNITIDTDLKDFQLKGSPQTLLELFVILLDNAIKYSPPNSVMTLNSKKKDGMAAVIIKDNGIGISKEDMPHIFDRFYRADKSRSQSDGYGLGLSIAQTIIRAHNGYMKVTSSLGKGTTFTVYLPINKKQNANFQ